ncbi:MAG TPA: hypothetical protein VHZ51_26310 [Ktedonobacteraceae bacterium]|jgi:hypothetical protein|nr:hypothetical protein [Ktedonobacteraceae bacterium]
MQDIAPEIVSIADACLGGLRGRAALLIGPEEQRRPYADLLRQEKIKSLYEEDTPERIAYLLPYVQLLISLPAVQHTVLNVSTAEQHTLPLTAASIAKGCIGRNKPLLILDLVPSSSVEELAGLLPAVCLYTPADLRIMLAKAEAKAS